jgi:hypothetical protein
MTKTALSTLLAAAFALAGARAAAAQPPVAPPPAGPPEAGPPGAAPDDVPMAAPAPAPAPVASQPPPAGGDASDVSHIRGTPVPVGDHNQYYYRFKRTNISTNPIGWMLGIYGLSLSYGISDHLAVRGDVNYFDPIGEDGTTGYEVGAGLPIYFRRTYSGLFLEPGAIIRRFSDDDDFDDDNTTIGPQILVGWHWMWDSGLNVAMAFGAGRNWAREDTESDYDDEEPFVNGYLRFGYAF